MTLPFNRKLGAVLATTSLVASVACVGGGSTRRPVAIPGPAPVVTPAGASKSVQGLYESGRYHEVLNSVAICLK